MKISIIGQDTLAAAIRECCARHFEVTAAPDPTAAIWWITYDTPIGTDDRPDSEWVIDRIRELLVDLDTKPLIIVSSQMPVGTTAELEREFPQNRFAHSPENIRVATAVADFENQARIVVGIRTPTDEEKQRIHELLKPFTQLLILTDPETAEMCKHALNNLLGLQIAFINEIARICVKVGADPETVSLALRSERRVSPHAPLKPGKPFGLGHLARDIYTLNRIARGTGVTAPIIGSIKASNDAHV